jgi:PAS domain S-box-containing protein
MIVSFKKSTFRLLMTMILVALLVTIVAIAVIFGNNLNNEKSYLKKLTENEYGMLVSFYRQTGNRQQVIEMIRDQQALHPALEETGEILVSHLMGDSIYLIQYKGINQTNVPKVLSLNGPRGEPGKFAALGNKGYVKGIDYRGRKVLAYGTYFGELSWGVVTKIDYSEIIKPFWEASLYAFIASLILVLIGSYFFKRFSDPLFERIRQNEEKYHTLFELIPSGITITDAKGGIIESNQESESLLGLPRKEHSSRRIDDEQWNIIRLDHSPMPASEYASTIALRENRVVTNIKMGIVKNRDEITWINVSAAPFTVKGMGVIIVYTDITALVEAENALRDRERQLVENARELKSLNETKDKFFSILAHDLKNPFGSLLGASEYLYREIDKQDTERVRKLSKILHESAKSGYDILTNLLEWSRSQTGSLSFEPELINLEDIVKKNINLVAALADSKNIAIHTDLDPGLELKADSRMLHSVLRNLLINSLKFTPEGGRVDISARKKENEIVVAVKDTGMGIPPEDLDKLFRIDVKYIARGTNREKGTGLGLILCKEFISKHGGNIWVESQLNEGSIFYFSIPL